MNFNDYQTACHETAIYPREQSLEYLTLGLVGEAGEVANKVKKIIRDHGGKIDLHQSSALAKELGDVLWYAAELAGVIGYDFDQVARANIEKLFLRKQVGTISGEGDNR